MKYMILIYVDPASYAGVSEAQQQAEMGEYYALGPSFRERGYEVTGDGLQPVETATTVRRRDGQYLITDGPFAETKEHLGGYYLIDCKNLDEALEFARAVPDVRHGSVEVRPVMDYGDMPA